MLPSEVSYRLCLEVFFTIISSVREFLTLVPDHVFRELGILHLNDRTMKNPTP